jgi:hypothetical protein
MNLAYRTTQFFRAMIAKPRPQELALVEANLSPPMAELFWKMSSTEQVHGLRVLRSLIAQGQNDPDLLAAALLHDVGKIRFTLHIWERVLIVLANWFIPEMVQRWGVGEPDGWRRPFVIASLHPMWGAEMVRDAGGSKILIDLVRRHQEPLSSGSQLKIDHLLHLLQETDGVN